MPIADLQRIIETRASCGEPLEAIEEQLIEPSGLPEDERSALWLYGWSCREAGRLHYQRRQQQLRRRARYESPRIGNE
jgi:hypothetical protein